jgi:Ser/Thr protein kinase RdoA (MazF antagonist)
LAQPETIFRSRDCRDILWTVVCQTASCSIRSAAELNEEHDFMAHLFSKKVPVSEVLSDEQGRSAIEEGEWTYEMHRVGAGADLYRDAVSWTPFTKAEHAFAAGQALAQLHVASRSYKAAKRRAKALVSSFTIFASDDPFTQLKTFVDERPALGEFLQTRRFRTRRSNKHAF